MTVFPIRFDSLEHLVIAVGPVAADASVVIVSSKQLTSKLTLQLLQALAATFDGIVYEFVATVLIILCIMLLALLKFDVGGKFTRKLKPYARLAPKGVWSVFGLLVDQEDHRPRSQSSRIFWTVVVMAMFVLVFGYFCGVMSTDLVAERSPPVITSFHDYLRNERWSHYLSYTFKYLFFYKYAQTAPKHTLAHELCQRLRNETVIEAISLQQMGAASSEMFRDLYSNAAGVFIEKLALDTILKPAVCSMESAIGDVLYHTKETIADGVLVWYYNRRLPPEVAVRYAYNMQVLFESDMIRATTKTYMPEIIEHLSGAYGVDARWCVDGHVENAVQLPVLRLASMKSLFVGCGQMVAVAIVVVAAELLLDRKLRRKVRKLIKLK